jgi:hypothetical protein
MANNKEAINEVSPAVSADAPAQAKADSDTVVAVVSTSTDCEAAPELSMTGAERQAKAPRAKALQPSAAAARSVASKPPEPSAVKVTTKPKAPVPKPKSPLPKTASAEKRATAKRVIKSSAAPSPKPAPAAVKKITPAKNAAAKVKAGSTSATAKPARPAVPIKPDQLPWPDAARKTGKEKLVRDSFTMPPKDFGLIAVLKDRALAFKRPTKKSELLRAGLQVLAQLTDTKLQHALDALAPLKAGRPKKSK